MRFGPPTLALLLLFAACQEPADRPGSDATAVLDDGPEALEIRCSNCAFEALPLRCDFPLLCCDLGAPGALDIEFSNGTAEALPLCC